MKNPIMGVTVLGPDHRFIMTNPTFQRMVGYTDTELKKLTAINITPSDHRDLNGRLFKDYKRASGVILSWPNSCRERMANSSGYNFMFLAFPIAHHQLGSIRSV